MPFSGAAVAIAVGFAVLLSQGASSARAEEPTVTASHAWLATTDLGDGTYAVTYRFTFTNTGNADLEAFQVEVDDSVPPSVLPGANEIAVGAIARGQSATVTVDITSAAPVDPGSPPITMIGHGAGFDPLGGPVDVAVTSEQEAGQ